MPRHRLCQPATVSQPIKHNCLKEKGGLSAGRIKYTCHSIITTHQEHLRKSFSSQVRSTVRHSAYEVIKVCFELRLPILMPCTLSFIHALRATVSVMGDPGFCVGVMSIKCTKIRELLINFCPYTIKRLHRLVSASTSPLSIDRRTC